MRIVHKEDILRRGDIAQSNELRLIEREITTAIHAVKWPEGADGFYLDPNARKGNGVTPIKKAFINYLKKKGWQKEMRTHSSGVVGTGPLDAAKKTSHGLFAVEWETGNISSSHRSLNKICLGVKTGELIGGVLVLPSIDLYRLLTDRVGNYREIVPYLPLWKQFLYKKEGVISIIVVDYDDLREGTPRIPKGTDGRALR